MDEHEHIATTNTVSWTWSDNDEHPAWNKQTVALTDHRLHEFTKLVESIRNDDLSTDEVARALVDLIRHEINAALEEHVRQLYQSGLPR